jgi:hypothetical protein
VQALLDASQKTTDAGSAPMTLDLTIATADLLKVLSHFAALTPGADLARTSPALSSARDQLEKLGLLPSPPTSGRRHLAADIWPPTSGRRHLAADIWVDGDGT